MDFTVVEAVITGKAEHDKFANEIARKNKHLKNIYDEVCTCISNIQLNSGYQEVDDMIDELKKVKTELVLMSKEMQKVMNNLEN